MMANGAFELLRNKGVWGGKNQLSENRRWGGRRRQVGERMQCNMCWLVASMSCRTDSLPIKSSFA